MPRSFTDFLGTKDRDAKKHLKILEQILKKSGFHVADHTEDRKDPYVYVYKPDQVDSILENLSFGGIRLYHRGKDLMCYRRQMKDDVEPFGETYFLDIRGMFKNVLGETHNKKKIGHEVIKYIIEELKMFFIDSAKAEKEEEPKSDQGKMGAVTAPAGGAGDYSNQVFNSSPQTSGSQPW